MAHMTSPTPDWRANCIRLASEDWAALSGSPIAELNFFNQLAFVGNGVDQFGAG
jgi:hypothetical protein